MDIHSTHAQVSTDHALVLDRETVAAGSPAAFNLIDQAASSLSHLKIGTSEEGQRKRELIARRMAELRPEDPRIVREACGIIGQPSPGHLEYLDTLL